MMRQQRDRRTTLPGTAAVLVLLGLLSVAGCQQQMAVQPSYRPLQANSFFPDGRASRNPVPGTVARQAQPIDEQYETGLRDPASGGAREGKETRPLAGVPANRLRDAWEDIDYLQKIPMAVDRDTLLRGRDRYRIYCIVCHGATGDGNGVVVERGYSKPPSFHTDRLRGAPVGYLFDVMTRGYGSMPQYAKQVAAPDRWAVAAYLRALQLSQHADLGQLPGEVRQRVRQQLENQRGPQ